MTREEAIKNIKEHCYFANLIPQAKEALDMAIEALEQESILDKVRTEIMDWQTDIHDNEYDAENHDFVFEGIYEIIDELKAESEVEK